MTERRAPERFDLTLSILFLSANGPVIVAGPFVQRHVPTPQAGALMPFFHQHRVVKEKQLRSSRRHPNCKSEKLKVVEFRKGE
jgi:hypothetical protein